MTYKSQFGELKNKTVLYVGRGHGEAIHELADWMSGGGGRLIITDISDEHFGSLKEQLQAFDLDVEFIRTSPLKLAGIRLGSIDLVVCDFELSIINAIVGQGELALHKMYEVLKPGGRLYLEEELPYDMAASQAQMIWAEKSKLLKTAQLLGGMRSSNEYQPDVLEELVAASGFEEIDVTDEVTTLAISNWWPCFEERFEAQLQEIENETLKVALAENKQVLFDKADALGSMDLPYFNLTALKPWRIE